MPELPEVETVILKLREILVDKIVTNLKIYKEKCFVNEEKIKIVGLKIFDVRRRGKLIFFVLENEIYLLCHLKMTGQLILDSLKKRISGGHPSSDMIASLPNQHTRVELHLSKENKLFFNDLRMFGYLKVVKKRQLIEILDKFGPEANQSEFSQNYFAKKIKKKKTIKIKTLLLDQNFVAGIGNIYASEILFLAKVHPEKLANSLNKEEIKKIIKFSKLILNKSIKKGGTTFDGMYVNAFGQKGGYQQFLYVYQRDGQKCLICKKAKIKKIKINGRGTFFCPNCQKN